VDVSGPFPDEAAAGIAAPGGRLYGPRGLVVDLAARRVIAGEMELHLTRQAFDLLAYLLAHSGSVVPTDELIRAIWGHTVVVGHHFVQTAIYRLRSSLRPAGLEDLVEVVRGVGYSIARDTRDEIRQSEFAGIEEALRVSALPAILIDPDQHILFANDAMARLTGYSVAELEALPSAELLSPPYVRERRRSDLEAILNGGSDEGWSEPVLRRDGSVVYLELFAEPIAVEDQIPVVLVQFWLKRGELSELAPLWRPTHDERETPEADERN
jgi:PAS domain S-box-containing protein